MVMEQWATRGVVGAASDIRRRQRRRLETTVWLAAVGGRMQVFNTSWPETSDDSRSRRRDRVHTTYGTHNGAPKICHVCFRRQRGCSRSVGNDDGIENTDPVRRQRGDQGHVEENDADSACSRSRYSCRKNSGASDFRLLRGVRG